MKNALTFFSPSILFPIACMLMAATVSNASVDFHDDIAPVLRDYCVGCHNNEDLDGELSLETFKQFRAGGENGDPIVAGKPETSLLFQMLTRSNNKKGMPPKREPQLSPEQIALFKNWILQGAPGPTRADISILGTLTVPSIPPSKGITFPITAAEYSPDGQRIALGQYGSVSVSPDLSIPFDGKVNSLHFGKDGKTLLVAGGTPGLKGTALLVALNHPANSDRKEPAIKRFDSKHGDVLYDAELSPDARWIATSGYDRTIVIWNTASGEPVRTIKGHNGAIFDLAFHPNSKVLASASADETIKLWRVEDGERLDTLNQPQGEQNAVLFTPNGKHIIGAGADNRIRLWQLKSIDSPETNPLLHARFGHENDIVALALSANGDFLVSSSSDRSVKVWSVPGLTQMHAWTDQPDIANALALSSVNRTVTVYRMDGSHQEWPIPSQPSPLTPGNSSVKEQPIVHQVSTSEVSNLTEKEPNNDPKQATPVTIPTIAKGAIDKAGDADLYRFEAKAGQEWVLEIEAARNKSKLDSTLEVLDNTGQPVERVVLQAVRDSWFTFRGKNSVTSGDFRVQNWREMELNEYLYANGEVVKLWLYPRGPDSGFNVYPGFGNRHTFFDTTALAHPVGEPIYIVQPFPAGTIPNPNGLPVFRLNYENDDESRRRWGNDSQLSFTAPKDGQYIARVRDVRGQGGKDYHYSLKILPREPGFKVSLQTPNPAVSPGSGREFTFNVDRIHGFNGPINITITNLPPGFSAPSPVTIETGQYRAKGMIFAEPDAKSPPADAKNKSKLIASATINDKLITQEVGSLGEIKLAGKAKILVEIQRNDGSTNPDNSPLEFTIAPGETISAKVKATRVDFKNRIELGGDDSGRNLPHGVYVDNIGLNGLLIVEGETERQFFITAAKWVPESTRFFHLRATADGGQTSRPAILHIRKQKTESRRENLR